MKYLLNKTRMWVPKQFPKANSREEQTMINEIKILHPNYIFPLRDQLFLLVKSLYINTMFIGLFWAP